MIPSETLICPDCKITSEKPDTWIPIIKSGSWDIVKSPSVDILDSDATRFAQSIVAACLLTIWRTFFCFGIHYHSGLIIKFPITRIGNARLWNNWFPAVGVAMIVLIWDINSADDNKRRYQSIIDFSVFQSRLLLSICPTSSFSFFGSTPRYPKSDRLISSKAQQDPNSQQKDYVDRSEISINYSSREYLCNLEYSLW